MCTRTAEGGVEEIKDGCLGGSERRVGKVREKEVCMPVWIRNWTEVDGTGYKQNQETLDGVGKGRVETVGVCTWRTKEGSGE